MKKFIIICALFLFSLNAFALETVTGQVTNMELSYMPGVILFTLDGGSTTCPAGAAIRWANADQNNNKIIYSALVLSMTSGKKIRVYINEGDTTCTGMFIYLLG